MVSLILKNRSQTIFCIFFSNPKAFDFDSTKNLFKSGVTRIGGLIENGKADKKTMFYMIAGLVVGFFILYKSFNLFRS